MFGWFKNRKYLKEIREHIAKEVLSMLELSSGFARDQIKGVGKRQLLNNRFVDSSYCRGYLDGFFDAVVEQNKIPVVCGEHLGLMKMVAYSYFFHNNAKKAMTYGYLTGEMASAGNDAEFNAAREVGYNDFCITLSERKMPKGLESAYLAATAG